MNLNKCRLCFENEASVNIFQSAEVSLLVKIKLCCGTLVIEENDGLPPSICETCKLELDTCYQFVLRCEAVDKKMRYLLLLSGNSICCDDKGFRDKNAYGPKTELKYELDDVASEPHASEEILAHYPLVELEPPVHVKPEIKDHHHYTLYRKKKYKKRKTLHKDELVCSVCGRRCQSSSALLVHMRAHTNERPFKCPSCDKTYKDNGTLKRHVERNHLLKRERHFICENCGKGFYSKSDIQAHMRVHTRETPYTCLICSARFTQLGAMLRHKRRHTDSKSYMCATCSKQFWTKEELKKHLSVHDEVRKFSCPICQVQFKQKGSIHKHMVIHSEPNRFVCSHCGKTFNNKGNLKTHIERKHSEKSGQCNVCFKNVSNIEVHMRRHTGQRPLQCELCPSTFREMRALTLHINFKHKKTDKFKCTSEGCARSFPSKPMLLFHVAKFHEHQTPYPCENCSRSFYRKNDLARHMLGTHKVKLL